ncbi:hypothetical protein NEF87_001662 [Candidatus Lokiarchaeum ossiferum]|uniref:ABC3 transporter permease C-terminal domain-containing protein n=1 Tax=Candidatus Lokiarchaeum ossiferum TaxID=2951803 RepID=A0ABY6HPF3_9ARCH|nr:hypothetical protein NEF87_001662 [Candidatus Lokiarchaeum sp. B-35]
MMKILFFLSKSFSKHKKKTGLYITCLTITIIFLTLIGSLTSSLNYVYFQNSSTYFGNQDIIISKKMETVGYNIYFNESLAKEIPNQIESIECLIPRLYIPSFTTKDIVDSVFPQQEILICGIDSQQEFSNPTLGSLWLCDEQLQNTHLLYENEILPGHCVLTKNAAILLNSSINDQILVQVATGEESLMIDAIVENDGRFAIYESALILTNLYFTQEFCQLENRINFLVGQFEHPEIIYDLGDLDGTQLRINAINQKIINFLDETYLILEPRLIQLKEVHEFTFFSGIIYDLMKILMVILFAFVIYSILHSIFVYSIRDHGLFQVIGASPQKIAQFQLIQNIIYMGPSLVLGILGGHLLAFLLFGINFEAIFRNSFNIFTIGLSILLCILPLFFMRNKNLIQILQPNRDGGIQFFTSKKFGNVNYKSLFIGGFILLMGEIIFFFLPKIAISNDSLLIRRFFLLLLIIILSGFIIIALNLLKYFNILLMQLLKWRKRDRRSFHQIKMWFATKHINHPPYVYMVLIIFTFNQFIATSQQLRMFGYITTIQYEYGTDLHIINGGNLQENNFISGIVLDQILSMTSVAQVSAMYATFSFETEINFQSQSNNINLQMSSKGKDPTFRNSLSNLGQLQEIPCGLMAVDCNYSSIIPLENIGWMEGSNSTLHSFDDLYNMNNSCIITEACALFLGIDQVGDYVSLSIWETFPELAEKRILQVAGIVSMLPGFTNIHTNQVSLSSNEAIIVSPSLYFDLLNQSGDFNAFNQKIDKILLKLEESTLECRDSFVKSFNAQFYNNLNYVISDPIQKREFFQNNEQLTRTYNYLIIGFSVFVNLIGISFAFNSLMDQRKHQLKILSAIGVSAKEKSRMLFQEMSIKFLSASIIGGFIGTSLSILVFQNVAKISEIPFLISVDYLTMSISFFGSLLFCIVSLSFLIKKHKITG